ncbi:MAG: hypothetical protein IJB49_05745 [Clostridia bacterium]|nr:hypothetical protein [Clostridia bacterium]
MKKIKSRISRWQTIVFAVSAFLCDVFCIAAVLPYFAIKYQDQSIIKATSEFILRLIPNADLTAVDIFRYTQLFSIGVAAICFIVAVIVFIIFVSSVARKKRKKRAPTDSEEVLRFDSSLTPPQSDANEIPVSTGEIFVLEPEEEDLSYLDSIRTLSLQDEDEGADSADSFVIEKEITYIHTNEFID